MHGKAPPAHAQRTIAPAALGRREAEPIAPVVQVERDAGHWDRLTKSLIFTPDDGRVDVAGIDLDRVTPPHGDQHRPLEARVDVARERAPDGGAILVLTRDGEIG